MHSDLVSGRKRHRGFCELCNVNCSNHDLTSHLSGKRHRTKVVQVARERPLVSNSTEPKCVWCRISFTSEARHMCIDTFLHSVRQRQFSNGVGIKSLTTGGDKAEVEYSTAKTSVWWDIENCEVPRGYDGHSVAENIRSVLLKRNYCGSLSIYAYGDTNQIASSVQQALSNTGVSLNHVPPGVKDGSDKKILVDMLLWAMENRAPANVMLISGDGDFSYVLHQLRMKKYNVLLVRPENASSPFLIAAAKTVMLWTSIVTAGSASEVPQQAEPRKLMKSNLVVEKNKSGPRFCQVCNISCTSLVDFNSHLSSKKHKKKAALVASQSSHTKQKKILYCSICQVHVPSSGNEEHKSGRKHKNKLKAQAGHSR